MSGSFLRNGGKRCFYGIVERRSIIDFYVSNEASILRKQQQSRDFARFPFSYKKVKEYGVTPSVYATWISSSSTSLSLKNGLVGWYLGMIESRPVLTKSVTSALIYTAADLSSQMITRESSESIDFIRTTRMAGYGMLILGPSLHFWFNFVSKCLPKRDLVSTLKKMFLGQTVYGPTMTVIFFSLNAALQGENSAEILARLKRDFVPTCKSGLMYWPICDFITFRFIPVRLQPLVSNSFSYLWTIYVTYMASLQKAEAV